MWYVIEGIDCYWVINASDYTGDNNNIFSQFTTKPEAIEAAKKYAEEGLL